MSSGQCPGSRRKEDDGEVVDARWVGYGRGVVPAAGMKIELLRGSGADARLLKSVRTNTDGRTDTPLLEGAEMDAGGYTLLFSVADYFRAKGHADAGKFLDVVPVAFVISGAGGKYHVPLLVSPWAYSTYRGS